MDLVLDLIDKDLANKKRIAVIGDAMVDVWVLGDRMGMGQENCLVFHHTGSFMTPGGAANAARQICHWNAETFLISPISPRFEDFFANNNVDESLCFDADEMPVKFRYQAPDGKCVFRCDQTDRFSPVDESWTELTLSALRNMSFDAVLLADYDKGFLSASCIQKIVATCNSLGVPLIVDAKRGPSIYQGCTLLKGNRTYAYNYPGVGHVLTDGAVSPLVRFEEIGFQRLDKRPAVHCRNHVGAGDCFSAHLALAIAHGFDTRSAAEIAHSAGRVFVQNLYARPPLPIEIRKDLNPKQGKIIGSAMLRQVRRTSHRVVWTNGVFRIPHPGHAWLLDWCKQQGDVLVVGVNDDASARISKGPENFLMPLDERVEWLAGLECVDWVVPFHHAEPTPEIFTLKPDVLAKGHEYVGRRIPGDDIVEDVRFGPPNAYPRHCTDLVEEIRGERDE